MRRLIPLATKTLRAMCVSLPNEHDFVDYPGNLDQQHAWREFGELSLDSAYAKFCENPLYYQESFMFMGDKAFSYYFPVLDRFIRKQAELDGPDSCDAYWIIANCIAHHFPGRDNTISVETLRMIIDLTDYVLKHLPTVDWECIDCQHSQNAIESAWKQLRNRLPHA